MRSEVFIGIVALALSMAPLSVEAACVGGAKNGVVEAGEQCDGGATDNCCKPDCTWRPVNGTQQGKCVDPGNPCSQGSCRADHTCDLSSTQSVPGHPSCVNINNECLLGECYNQVCKPIGNDADQWAERCPQDADQCLTNECVVDQFGNFIECDDDSYEPAGTNCSTVSGTACTIKACDGNGNCNATGGSQPTCTGSPTICEQFQCVPGGGQVQPTCIIVNKPIGADCDNNDWDCKHQQCKSNGSCGNQPAGAGERCDPDTDSNHCQLGTCGSGTSCQSGTVVNVPNGVVQFDDPPSPPLCPDNSPCTDIEHCNGSGGCTRTASGAMNGSACAGPNTCAEASACSGVDCVPTSCRTTGNCLNCSSAPACTTGTNCGCQ